MVKSIADFIEIVISKSSDEEKACSSVLEFFNFIKERGLSLFEEKFIESIVKDKDAFKKAVKISFEKKDKVFVKKYNEFVKTLEKQVNKIEVKKILKNIKDGARERESSSNCGSSTSRSCSSSSSENNCSSSRNSRGHSCSSSSSSSSCGSLRSRGC